jgi:hypothetical protein
MFLPVQNKPLAIASFKDLVTEIPNLVTKDVAEELREFALDKDLSGLHRRGSKSGDCFASFYTCLVFQHNHRIYDILDSAWEQFCAVNNPLIDFIEPYEIKSYVEGDVFGPHSDILINTERGLERKMNLIIQLSDEKEYDGGDLLIGANRCSRKQGTGIFFPSHYIHSVTEITRGTRFSLVGHAWGPRFK